MTTQQNKLEEFISSATEEELDQCARVAGTSSTYLYHLAKQYRNSKPSVVLALGVDRATKEIRKLNKGRTPHVTVQDIGSICGFGETEKADAT
jgi:AraC-like DNA-binding protein